MRISLTKHRADHFDADGHCQCGKPCCVHHMDGTCQCTGCACQQTPLTDGGIGLSTPYSGAYTSSTYRYDLGDVAGVEIPPAYHYVEID